jgi:hypothetical protein
MQNKLFTSFAICLAALVIIGSALFINNSEQDSTPAAESLPPAPVMRDSEPEYSDTESETLPAPDTAEVAPLAPPSSMVAAPLSLEESDPMVLLAVADFAPGLKQWLLPAEQIRKWVLAIDLMADGKLPKRYRPLDYPMVAFSVEQQGLESFSASANYARMNAIIATVTAIDPKLAAHYYRQWLPLLEKAYQEQGKPDTFDQRLRLTISRILAAAPPAQNLALIHQNVMYEYENQATEQATDIDKLMWRMGPDNTERLQLFLHELRDELDRS